jgi:hypothetical protein
MNDTAPHLARPLTRRSFARLVGAAGLVAIGGVKAVNPALAARAWCRTDPYVRIGGKEARVYVVSFKDGTDDVSTGPIEVIFRFPRGLRSELLWVDDGFGLGYDVRFEPDRKLRLRRDGRFPVRVNVVVPASRDDLVVGAEFEPAAVGRVTARAAGQTNDPVRLVGQL